LTWLESDKSDWIAKEFVLESFNKASNADLFLLYAMQYHDLH